MKMRLHDIKLFDLDSQTVLLISRFVRKTRVIDGVVIHLNDPLVIRKVVAHGLASRNSEIQALFRSISVSLNSHYELDIPASLKDFSVENVEGGANKRLA